jgi:hypothetical protein
VCRFSAQRSLIVNNRKQFDLENFKEFCTSIGTKIAFASVYYPESNGAVERANRIVFLVISKTLLNLHKGKWVEELPKVVWSHNTIVSRATGFTPFRLRTIRQAMAEDEEY